MVLGGTHCASEMTVNYMTAREKYIFSSSSLLLSSLELSDTKVYEP